MLITRRSLRRSMLSWCFALSVRYSLFAPFRFLRLPLVDVYFPVSNRVSNRFGNFIKRARARVLSRSTGCSSAPTLDEKGVFDLSFRRSTRSITSRESLGQKEMERTTYSLCNFAPHAVDGLFRSWNWVLLQAGNEISMTHGAHDSIPRSFVPSYVRSEIVN